jgi:hypothetical protein
MAGPALGRADRTSVPNIAVEPIISLQSAIAGDPGPWYNAPTTQCLVNVNSVAPLIVVVVGEEGGWKIQSRHSAQVSSWGMSALFVEKGVANA